MSDEDQTCESFLVAGAVFGEVGLSLLVAGAACREILGDSWSAKRCIFPCKCFAKMGRVNRRARDDDFIIGLSSGYSRIVVGSWLNRLSIGGRN